MVGTRISPRDHRERQPKGYTGHEVTAPRAVGPAGRPKSLLKIKRKSPKPCQAQTIETPRQTSTIAWRRSYAQHLYLIQRIEKRPRQQAWPFSIPKDQNSP